MMELQLRAGSKPKYFQDPSAPGSCFSLLLHFAADVWAQLPRSIEHMGSPIDNMCYMRNLAVTHRAPATFIMIPEVGVRSYHHKLLVYSL